MEDVSTTRFRYPLPPPSLQGRPASPAPRPPPCPPPALAPGVAYSSMTLPGSHITPCSVPLAGAVGGPSFTVLDALRMAAEVQSQADVRNLASQVLGWL